MKILIAFNYTGIYCNTLGTLRHTLRQRFTRNPGAYNLQLIIYPFIYFTIYDYNR